MSKRFNINFLVSIICVLFLVIPYILLIFKVPITFEINFSELSWVIKNTVIQAALSSLFIVGIGFYLSFGIQSFYGLTSSSRAVFLFELFLILPSFMPALFVLISLMNLIDPFPIGILGIVLVNTFINIGFSAFMWRRVLIAKLGRMTDLAFVEGAGFLYFWRNAFGLFKKDFINFFISFFLICFLGFSVPIVVGGGRGTTLEILIYEKIKISTDFSQALTLSLIQVFLISILVYLTRKYKAMPNVKNEVLRFNYLLESKVSFLFCMLYICFFWIGYARGFFYSLDEFFKLNFSTGYLVSATVNTILISFSVTFFVYAFLSLVVYLWPNKFLSTFLSTFVTPGSILIAFSFLPLTHDYPALVLLIFALSINFIPSIYRLGFERQIDQLDRQISVAKIMGASRFKIFSRIVFPQISIYLSLLSGIAGFWAMGDYALSKVLIGRDESLALAVESLLSTYRLGAATVISLLIALLGLFLLLLCWGVGRVGSRKFIL